METKKLSIKTITCHDVYNFGASLQAYALMKYLQNLGHDVEIIDYKPDYLTFNLWAIGPKWDKNIFLKLLYFTFVVPKRISLKKRRTKFEAFTKSKLKLTEVKYNSYKELKANPPLADLYFAGSDQIWNPLLPNGKDASFFLQFTPSNPIRASYAASFSVSKILENEVKEIVKKRLHTFDLISVRESSAIGLLKNLEIQEAEIVVDPVYLLEDKDWDTIANFESKEKYIFIYDQENNKKIRDTALSLAKKYNLKIYAIESLYPLSYADKRIKDAGPENFIGLIKNCEICLTNSFHCISFSLIFKKEFYLFKRTHLKVNSRMLDLLNYLNLSDRVADEKLDSLSLDKIDYKPVNILISKRKESSLNYINKAIRKACDKKGV